MQVENVKLISGKIKMETVNIFLKLATAFDPKPFIRTFENVLEELQHLKTRVQEQCNELENSTQTAEQEYKRNITDLHGAFDVSSKRNDSLRELINVSIGCLSFIR